MRGLAACNPLAKLAATTVLALALVVTVDPVTAGVTLAGELLALPWAGLTPRSLARRAAVVALGAVPSAVLTVLVTPPGGRVLVAAGPLGVSSASLVAGLAVGLRVAALALPGVVLLATTDPTDLADALAQRLHAPARAVLAALAAVRLVDVLIDEWQMLGLARRARGLGDGGLLGRPRELAARTFALLVLALRRASVLATAMEARGFGVVTARTWARTSPLNPRDGLLVGGAVALAATATTLALLAGTWHVLLG